MKIKHIEIRMQAIQRDLKFWKSKTVILQKEHEKLKKINEKNKKDFVISILKGTFTETQIYNLLERKKKIKWKKEDMNLAFTLRYLSIRSYLYLRNQMNIPLPAVSTLQRWASKINLCQGILNDVINIMKIKGFELSEEEKLTVLQFDEMKVKRIYEYDKVRNKVIGPKNQVLVMMARGLFA
ncbi:uncharacterized protein LOC111630895 [Centruroides sculpturatus]|uniref:uncharacterized protein LOC111630895 n=1 Tax=Centruroides sculpturatus TaxID=218467 RepID=UPI000C6D3118|nr:uncharacterized protein LOC111630895 [Centruroides sculpturatus]